MARLTWLAGVLRGAGLQVEEMAGSTTRGRSDITVQGVVCHHTATGPNWSDAKVATLLRDGRSDLPGPLSQLGLSRNGTFVVVATGRCSHNGYGEWGNDSVGIEAYNSGTGEPWPAAQVDAYQRGVAAILRHVGLPVSRCKGHKETDPNRKVDPAGIDMNQFRSRVAGLLNNQEPDDMYDAAARNELIARIDELRTESDANWTRLVSLETSMAWVGGVLADLAGRSTTVNVDAAAVAAAIPDDLAQQVADVLAERLRE